MKNFFLSDKLGPFQEVYIIPVLSEILPELRCPLKGKIASDIVWGCLHNRKLEQAKTQYNPYDEEMYLCETAGATNILYYGDNQTEIINTSMHELRNIGSTISSMVCQGCDNPNPFPECDIDYLQYETILDKTYPDREQL